MRLLVTGGAGFIGSNFARVALKAGHAVTVLDALTYCGNLANLDPVKEHEGFYFVKGDIRDGAAVEALLRDESRGARGAPFDALLNFAAESHVDRSILDAGPFVSTNIGGTQTLLDAVRRFSSAASRRAPRFLQVSTDEVYGSTADQGGQAFTESMPLQPNSPYAASKAAADLLVRAFHRTHGLDALVTRCSNNYGPYQFPEKLIPLFTTNLLEGRKVPVYGDGMQVRDWIHADDHSRGLLAALEKGRPGEVYNLGAGNPKSNLEITRLLLQYCGRDESFIEHVQDRPGHDREYRIESAKAARELGWRPSVPFAEGLKATVEWYRRNEKWWREIKSGEYRKYYERQYGKRQAGWRK